jgi:hypothetical protein
MLIHATSQDCRASAAASSRCATTEQRRGRSRMRSCISSARTRRACDCAGANATRPPSVMMRGILTPALRSGSTPCLSSVSSFFFCFVSASASYRRSQTPSARGTLGSRGPHRSHVAGSSAYFRIVSIEMPGPLVPAGKPATLGNASSAAGGAPWHTCVEHDYVRITSDAPGGNRKATEMRKCLYSITRCPL